MCKYRAKSQGIIQQSGCRHISISPPANAAVLEHIEAGSQHCIDSAKEQQCFFFFFF